MRFLPRAIFSLLGNSALMWALQDHVLPGKFTVSGGIKGFVVLALFIGVINFLIKPLLNLVTLPLKWITLGLFQLVINAFLIFLLEWKVNFFQLFDTALQIEGGWTTYLIAGVIVAVFNGILHWFEK